MFSETHRPVNYRSILEIYLESAYFTREFEKFRSRHIGFCFRNGKQYTFQSYSYATYSQKIGTQAIGASLSCKMTDELIGKYFNSGYSTKQLFAILMAQLMDMDSAQLAQLEDQRCSFCSEALLSQFMHKLKKSHKFLVCKYRMQKRRTAFGRCMEKKHTSWLHLIFIKAKSRQHM